MKQIESSSHSDGPNWITDDKIPFSFLRLSACIALIVELVLITAIGWHEHWLAHPTNTQDESQFIETEVFEVPSESHLSEEKHSSTTRSKPEISISKKPGSHSSSADQAIPEEENQTETGPKIAPTHGPIAVYSPPPVLPTYLQNREFRTNVVIDFYIHAQGTVTPRLAGSSGDEELDAIALEAVKKWQFRPAEKDHKAIDAKVRLRIVFEVK